MSSLFHMSRRRIRHVRSLIYMHAELDRLLCVRKLRFFPDKSHFLSPNIVVVVVVVYVTRLLFIPFFFFISFVREMKEIYEAVGAETAIGY